MARHRRGGKPGRWLDLRLSSVPFAEVEESDRQDTDPDWLGSPRRLARRFPGRRDRDVLYGEDCVSLARTLGSVLICNSLRHLCVLGVSAVSVFQRPFTAETQRSPRLRREKLKSGRYKFNDRQSIKGKLHPAG